MAQVKCTQMHKFVNHNVISLEKLTYSANSSQRMVSKAIGEGKSAPFHKFCLHLAFEKKGATRT